MDRRKALSRGKTVRIAGCLACWGCLMLVGVAAGQPSGYRAGMQPPAYRIAQAPVGEIPLGPPAPETPALPTISRGGNPQALAGQPVHFEVKGPTQRLEMVVNTSRILTLGRKIPQAQVNNPEIARLTPLAAEKIQISALKPGVTQVNLWDQDENVYSVDVIVYGDARELQMLLNSQFPQASINVVPLASSVLITGTVPRPEMVSRITQISEDYYGKVINHMRVEGVQQVMLHVKVMEVSRNKLRSLGFDFANINGDDFVASSISGLLSAATVTSGATVVGGGGDTVRFGIVNDGNAFFGFIEALRRNNLVKVLAEPTLTTVSGRPASFNVGGEFPITVPSGLGTVSVEFKEFGTRVDFVPIVLGNGNIRLEARPQISEIDESRGVTISNTTVPGLRTRWVDTAVEMKAGQTLALAGLIQTRMEAENKGIPWVADLPWVGSAFRRVQYDANEIELLIMVRPELVDALDPHEVPPCGPGQFTATPNDVDLYWRGYLEVPRCPPGGPCHPGMPAGFHPGMPPQLQPGMVPAGEMLPPGYEAIPQPTAAPTQAAGPTHGHLIPVGRHAVRNAYASPEPRITPASARRSHPPIVQPPANPQPAVVIEPPTAPTSAPVRTTSRPPTRPEPPAGDIPPEPDFMGPLGYDPLKR